MTPSRPRSLRRILIFGTLLLVAACLGASAWFGFRDAQHEAGELFDARLAQSARITGQLLARYLEQPGRLPQAGRLYDPWEPPADDGHNEEQEDTPLGHRYEHKLYFQLFDTDGRLLLRSPNAPQSIPHPVQPGFGFSTYQQHVWRTFTLNDRQRQTWLIVAERDDGRDELAGKIAGRAMLPLAIALPFLLLLLWGLIAYATRPLTQLIQAISERHPANLSPLKLQRPIRELLPLAGEINRLMRALADTLEREKQFTNEAAHELRTPLAVLRIHAENALAATNAGEREQSLQKMLRGLDRGERLIGQLLTLARLDNQQAIALETVDLNALLRESVATLAPLALQKQQDLALEADESLQIRGQPTLLGLLFNNLIDNAIRYTPEGGKILVSLAREGSQAVVYVRDSGPGVTPEYLPRLSERFFRANPQYGDGAGLGMSIVQKIAELHQANLSISNRATGGLEVSLQLRSEAT